MISTIHENVTPLSSIMVLTNNVKLTFLYIVKPEVSQYDNYNTLLVDIVCVCSRPHLRKEREY